MAKIDRDRKSISEELFREAPILAQHRSDGYFILDTDASNEGIGAVLSQIQDGEERVIAFASKTLMKTERNSWGCYSAKMYMGVVSLGSAKGGSTYCTISEKRESTYCNISERETQGSLSTALREWWDGMDWCDLAK